MHEKARKFGRKEVIQRMQADNEIALDKLRD